jgi:hypothetical protein
MKHIRFIKISKNLYLAQVRNLFGWHYYKEIQGFIKSTLAYTEIIQFKSEKEGIKYLKEKYTSEDNIDGEIIVHPTIKHK